MSCSCDRDRHVCSGCDCSIATLLISNSILLSVSTQRASLLEDLNQNSADGDEGQTAPLKLQNDAPDVYREEMFFKSRSQASDVTIGGKGAWGTPVAFP